MAHYRTAAFQAQQARRAYGALVRGDVRGYAPRLGELVPMIVPMETDPKADRRQQLWDSILVGVGVSLGTTLALGLLRHFFGGNTK